jgi:hypothetical protein
MPGWIPLTNSGRPDPRFKVNQAGSSPLRGKVRGSKRVGNRGRRTDKREEEEEEEKE